MSKAEMKAAILRELDSRIAACQRAIDNNWWLVGAGVALIWAQLRTTRSIRAYVAALD